MPECTFPPEQGSFRMMHDRSRAEELLEAGKYEWVADYSRRMIQSKTASLVGEPSVEIVLLGSLQTQSAPTHLWNVSVAPDVDLADVFSKYDRPTVWDVLRFGALYPDEQRKAALIFPHEPWSGPHGPTCVLVLRTQAGARGLSYVTYSGAMIGNWWWNCVVAVRRRGGPQLSVVS
jgi:hypothetical protein